MHDSSDFQIFVASFRRCLQVDIRALLVSGARQAGKTITIRKIAQECFDNKVEINFDASQGLLKNIVAPVHIKRALTHRFISIIVSFLLSCLINSLIVSSGIAPFT